MAKKIFLLIIFLLSVFFLNYEFFYINAEGIFIISFLLFTFLFYSFARSDIAQLLDNSSLEILQKLSEVNQLQRTTLKEQRLLLEQWKTLNLRVLPLFIFTLHVLEQQREKLLILKRAKHRNLIENKYKQLLLEASSIGTESDDGKATEIVSQLFYENKQKTLKIKGYRGINLVG
jgi:hypothetical protein